jgi:hypothetical protein
MKFTHHILASLLSAAFSFSANAGLVDYAVSTYVNGTDINATNSGGDNMSNTYNEVNSQNKAMASLSGNSLLPTLKVMAQSSGAAYSRALAVQKFTYDGTAMSNFELNFNLHGDVSAGSSLRADIGVILTDQVYFYDTYGFDTNFFEGAMVGADNIELGYDVVLSDTGMDQNKASSLTFDLQPGDSFFVYASVAAMANNGLVDAWNTLTMDFTDNTGLTAASFTPPVSVPEPSSIILMLSALVLFSSRKTFNK